jgi:hypothetical protein
MMSKFCLGFLVMVISASTLSAADITGTWSMALTADWTTIPQLVCTMTQKDQELTGRCSEAGNPDDRGFNLDRGKVDGDQLSWAWKVTTPDGEMWTYALTGMVDTAGTAIKGSFTLSSRFSTGKGSFTATKK